MIKPIIKNRSELNKPCELVGPDDDITQILIDLEETLAASKGLGLAANQIGYNKQIAITRVDGEKLNLINPVIIDKNNKIIFRRESCLSFPGIFIDTDRWAEITIENGVKGEDTIELKGIESIVVQHEITHLKGRTIFDCKHKKR